MYFRYAIRIKKLRNGLQMLDQQAAADKEARRIVRLAYKSGGQVGFSLSRLMSLKISVKVIRAVYRSV